MQTPFDAALSEEARAEVVRRPAAIEREDNVRILLAVESGSRAWGFHSPDSGDDARFIYVRPGDDYLPLYATRDVIERPIVDLVALDDYIEEQAAWGHEARGPAPQADPDLLRASDALFRAAVRGELG